MNYSIKEVHISLIMPGDTIEHNGDLKTVCKNNIKFNQFLGTTIFGDSYMCGQRLVRLATISRALPSDVQNDA